MGYGLGLSASHRDGASGRRRRSNCGGTRLGRQPRDAHATPRQMLAWAFFDWASSPFFAVVITFVFATYVTTVVAPNEIEGTAQWGWR